MELTELLRQMADKYDGGIKELLILARVEIEDRNAEVYRLKEENERLRSHLTIATVTLENIFEFGNSSDVRIAESALIRIMGESQ